MNQEGAPSRAEDAELPVGRNLIVYPKIDAAAYEHEVGVPVDHIAGVEDEAHESRPIDQPGLLDIVHPQQPLDAAALSSELRAFQEGESRRFGRFPQRQLEDHLEAEGIYDSSSEEDSEDDHDSEPGDINKHQLVEFPEPAANIMDQNSKPAGDINMTDQDPKPAGDINTVHDDSVPACDIDIEQYSEHDHNMMDLDSDTNVDNLAESQSTVLQETKMHDRLAAETTNEELYEKAQKPAEQVETLTPRHELAYEVVVRSPTQPRIEELYTKEWNRLSAPLSDHSSLTAAPSPLPSSELQPSSSTLTICESSLEPNLFTTIKSTKSME